MIYWTTTFTYPVNFRFTNIYPQLYQEYPQIAKIRCVPTKHMTWCPSSRYLRLNSNIVRNGGHCYVCTPAISTILCCIRGATRWSDQPRREQKSWENINIGGSQSSTFQQTLCFDTICVVKFCVICDTINTINTFFQISPIMMLYKVMSFLLCIGLSSCLAVETESGRDSNVYPLLFNPLDVTKWKCMGTTL